MCDYSIQHIASRPAQVGDELITIRFANSITRGFCAVGEPKVAVCVLPGTELAFQREAEYDHPLVPFLAQKVGGKVARFRQINRHDPYSHHDALEFTSGKIVLLTRLRPGQRVTVLQLPTQPSAVGAGKRSFGQRHRRSLELADVSTSLSEKGVA